MTAEIAILNAHGVALAADSAVTIQGQKVYNTALKLFSLSKFEPVGVMIYDSADLLGIPWEVIIKNYREELGKKSFDELGGYVEDFWEYLSLSKLAVPSEIRERSCEYTVLNFYRQIYEDLRLKVEKISDDQKTLVYDTTKTEFELLLKNVLSVLQRTEFTDGMNQEIADYYRDSLTDLMDKEGKAIFGKLFDDISSASKETLYSATALTFVKNYKILSVTGVVFAGYGRSDVFPRISSSTVETVYRNEVKRVFNPAKSNIDHVEFRTFVVPFAQDEMVWTFLDGVDPNLRDFAGKLLDRLFEKYPQKVDDFSSITDPAIREDLKEKLNDWGKSLLKSFADDFSRYQMDVNQQPILDMVRSLPKDELAAMAESLVNLTVFKRKVTGNIETVGGPIDVAIISKGDGFIWIKRKHYFKPDLNPAFFDNYYRNTENERV